MKLTKSKINKLVGPLFIEMGFTYFKDSVEGTKGLYCKKIEDKLFLSIGMNISSLYDDQFSCDLYLSQSTRIGCCWGDIPKTSYTRPGYLLNDSEINKYNGSQGDLFRDIWWHSNSDSIKIFFDIVKIAIDRMSSNYELQKDIMKSADAHELYFMSKSVIDMVENDLFERPNYRYIPTKPVDNIPEKWFKATEVMLENKSPSLLNCGLVKSIASDAFRIYYLEKS